MTTDTRSLPKSGLITVISDTICPWCYVGKRRLEVALLALTAEGLAFEVEWLPFQLNPDMPDAGLLRHQYRAAKFGTSESDALDARMTSFGHEVGIDFRFDRIQRTPNTLASHVMVADARRAGGFATQNLAIEALFSAYFEEGLDVGNTDVLRQLALRAGFDHGPSASAELWELVQKQERSIREAGVSGVPTFLLNGHQLFQGAQAPEVIGNILRDTVMEQVGKVSGTDVGTCI